MIQRITKLPTLPKAAGKKRVAAYARVSSGKDAMLHSLASQVSHYSALIQSHPDWEYAGVYSDEAFTGTRTDRPGFTKMLEAADAGLIDVILTKSVSRFARNASALLTVTRRLKAKGVEVRFEEENLSSFSAEGEVVLTLVAAMAEAEARDVSDNMLWRIRRDMANGLYWGGTCPYGFRVEGRSLVKIPEEAAVVQRMFEMYEGGVGDATIAKALNRDGIPGRKGGKWQAKTVREVLMNLAHTGDLVLQKTFRPDCLTKKDAKNHGERPQYSVRGAHEGIVSRETYERCMAIRAERAARSRSTAPREPSSPLSRLIRCPRCGSALRRKANSGRPIWRCRLSDRMGKEYCVGVSVCETPLIEALNEATSSETLEDAVAKIDAAVPMPEGTLEVRMKNGTVATVAIKGNKRKKKSK